ncbi:MAG: hypothetical protein INF34_00195 [Roseomonas sp.]|nr:hypothetical protein [Roseomonas sp.]
MMLNFRKFRPQEDILAQEWSSQFVAPAVWQLTEERLNGEAQSRWAVRNDGVRAVAKPAVSASGEVRGAHAKNTAEHALRCGVPVPPVQLWTDNSAGQRYSLSAAAFPQSLTWAQAQQSMTPEFRKNLIPVLTSGYVFHSWIDDRDHGGHPENLLISADSSETDPAIAIIDHAFSLTHGWKSGVPAFSLLNAYYLSSVADCAVDVMIAVMSQIEAIDEGTIFRIVNRIPTDYLDDSLKSLIINGLQFRTQGLKDAVSFLKGESR